MRVFGGLVNTFGKRLFLGDDVGCGRSVDVRMFIRVRYLIKIIN